MTRLPSLKQLSDRLHSSPSINQVQTETSRPVTPPKLNVSINTANPSPFAQSPSSRLRLPPSAIKRTLSATSNIITTSTLVSLSLPPRPREQNLGDVFATTDPFATDPSRGASMSRQSSSDGLQAVAGPTVLIGGVKGLSEEMGPSMTGTAKTTIEREKVHPLRHAWYVRDRESSTSTDHTVPIGHYTLIRRAISPIRCRLHQKRVRRFWETTKNRS